MPDRSFLDWPFCEDRHRALAAALDAWCAEAPPVAHDDVDTARHSLVAMLGEAGWLRHTAAENGGPPDVRTLCLIRETLARHDGLADFAFAMQGLGFLLGMVVSSAAARLVGSGPDLEHAHALGVLGLKFHD